MISGHSNSFDTGIAKSLGLNAAIVFNHIVYWLKINSRKESNIRDGKVWMYETQQDMADYFEYLTLDDVKKAVVKLLESGLLIKGNYNVNPFDKTAWYTVADENIFRIKKTLSKEPYGSIGRATGLDRKSPTAPSIYKVQEEHIQEEQQQHPNPFSAAAVSFLPEKEKPRIFSCLEPIEIPWHDKVEISKQYQESVVVNGIGWATHPDNRPKKCLAASIKYACSMGFSAKDIIQSTVKTKASELNNSSAQQLIPQEVAGLNKAYFRELNKVLYSNGFRNLFEEYNEYLIYDDPSGKKTRIYFKDTSFLEQISSFLRKKNCNAIIFSTIKILEEDFIKQRGKA